jgi:hypothetical protein
LVAGRGHARDAPEDQEAEHVQLGDGQPEAVDQDEGQYGGKDKHKVWIYNNINMLNVGEMTRMVELGEGMGRGQHGHAARHMINQAWSSSASLCCARRT